MSPGHNNPDCPSVGCLTVDADRPLRPSPLSWLTSDVGDLYPLCPRSWIKSTGSPKHRHMPMTMGCNFDILVGSNGGKPLPATDDWAIIRSRQRHARYRYAWHTFARSQPGYSCLRRRRQSNTCASTETSTDTVKARTHVRGASTCNVAATTGQIHTDARHLRLAFDTAVEEVYHTRRKDANTYNCTMVQRATTHAAIFLKNGRLERRKHRALDVAFPHPRLRSPCPVRPTEIAPAHRSQVHGS